MSSLRKLAARAGCAGLALILWGCTADRPADVPADADVQVDGSQRLVYTAPAGGRIWVTDVPSNSVVYAGTIHRGEEIAVDPSNNRVTIAGQVVTTHDVGQNDHRVYFESGTVEMNGGNLAARNIDRPADVPAAAKLTSEGAARVVFTTDAAGTIWVVDALHNNVIYSGKVAQGDQIIVDPDGHNLTVNGNKVLAQPLMDDVDRTIFFLPATEILVNPQ